jgi:parallel beta-helix repeat protein
MKPMNGMEIKRDASFEPGVYALPDGIVISADNVTLDGRGAVLVGTNQFGQGITIQGASNVTIKNLHILNYYHAISATGCRGLTIANCRCTGTAEIPANTIFLDIWKPAQEAYGGGIFLEDVSTAQILDNDLQHQMNGLLAYGCRGLRVQGNLANYCSGFGFYLHETNDSEWIRNYADYCCRYEPRGEGTGHMGADAAGFVIVNRSCWNRFIENMARLSGDGFFLAGLHPSGEHMGCDQNLFEGNDGSYSPNIAFEGTFSSGNVYRHNKASNGNYGFWLGFSADCLLEGSEIGANRQAGVAVENGTNMMVRDNDFLRNTYGVLLWSKYVASFARSVPQNDTSRDWLISHNRFRRNGIAVRIAADQDHGVRPMPVGMMAAPLGRHVIRDNELKDNGADLQVEGTHEQRMVESDFPVSGKVLRGPELGDKFVALMEEEGITLADLLEDLPKIREEIYREKYKSQNS